MAKTAAGVLVSLVVALSHFMMNVREYRLGRKEVVVWLENRFDRLSIHGFLFRSLF
jgi:hypothetical protein